MKFLILNADYTGFLSWLYSLHPGLEKHPYAEQMRVRNESLFGVADFYSSNLRKLGHEAQDIHFNNKFMQRAWAREHDIRISLMRRWQSRILEAQIKYYRPDVVLNQAMDGIENRFLKKMKKYIKLLVGQIAAPLPQGQDFGSYDLVISSLPNIAAYFRSLGIRSEVNRMGFEPNVSARLGSVEKDTIPVSFVGGFSKAHSSRINWLEYLCKHLDIKIWGIGIENLPVESPIHKCYNGQVWGVEMYQIFYKSKITLNYHIDIAAQYANNMRLYEATGVGALLLTDWKENLHEIFEPNKEVIVYRTPEECVDLIKYYLEHKDERKTIARAGQKRTLGEHAYYYRMQELVEAISKIVKK